MVGRRILKYSFSLNCRNLDLTLGVESNNLAAISSPVIGPWTKTMVVGPSWCFTSGSMTPEPHSPSILERTVPCV